jgi:hypothetical protein
MTHQPAGFARRAFSCLLTPRTSALEQPRNLTRSLPSRAGRNDRMSDRNSPKDDARAEGLANRSVNSPRPPAGSAETPRPSPATGAKDPAKVPDQQIPKDR